MNKMNDNDFMWKRVYSEFEICVEKVRGWKQGMDFDNALNLTWDYINEEFDDLTKEQMKMVYEAVESGFSWDLEKDECIDLEPLEEVDLGFTSAE
jgi:hypothetical protein